MRKVYFTQQGFTLVELVIGMLLTVLLLAGIGSLLSVTVQSWMSGSSRTEVRQTARYAMDMMVRELRYANTFIKETPLPNNAVDSIKFSDLAAPTPNQYRYYLKTSDHILYRVPVSPAGSEQPVTGANVSGSTNVVINQDNTTVFEVLDSNTVVITLTATDTVRNESYTLRSVVVSITQYLK